MMHNEKIPMPTRLEKRQAIDRIINEAMPERQSKATALVHIFRALGLRGLLFDIYDCVALAAMTSALVFLALIAGECDMPYITTFSLSPLFYLVLYGAVRLRERGNGIEQLKYTMRYTPVHICVAQNILFSVVSLAVCALMAFGASSAGKTAAFPELWCVGIISQLICSALTLVCLDRRNKHLPDIAAGGYAAFCLLVLLADSRYSDYIEPLLKGVSLAALIITAALLVTVYVFSIFRAADRAADRPKGDFSKCSQ